MDFDTAQNALMVAAAQKDAAVPLAQCALLIAACRNTALDPAPYIDQVEALTQGVRRRAAEATGLLGHVHALNQLLVGDEGFRGNTDDYADVRNSFLNEVLDRKLGIPITLSVLYIEIGERLGMDVRGVSFPGHFLVRFADHERVVVVDPFFGGVSLSEADLLERMQRFVPEPRQARRFLAQVLRGAPKLEILVRILRNLRENYASRGDLEAALTAADQIVSLNPKDPLALRERGELYLRLEVPHAAQADLAEYLRRVPDAPDAVQIREKLIDLGHTPRHLN